MPGLADRILGIDANLQSLVSLRARPKMLLSGSLTCQIPQRPKLQEKVEVKNNEDLGLECLGSCHCG